MSRDLLARLRAATVPDRELDEAIFLAFNPGFETRWPDKEPGYVWLPGVGSENSRHLRVPRFTASIDAALALVPEGWAWDVGSDNEALLWLPNRPENITGNGATPALALCIAAIQARETTNG